MALVERDNKEDAKKNEKWSGAQQWFHLTKVSAASIHQSSRHVLCKM